MCHHGKEEQKSGWFRHEVKKETEGQDRKCHWGKKYITPEQDDRKSAKCHWKIASKEEDQKFAMFGFGQHHHHHHQHHRHHHHCGPPPPPSCHRFYHHGPHRHHCGPSLIITPQFSRYYYEAMKD